MNSYAVAAIPDGMYFTDNVFLDDSFLLLDKSIPLSSSIKKALTDWDFKAVLSDGTQKSTEKPFFEPESIVPQPEQKPASGQKKEIPQNTSFESVDINDLLGLPEQNNPMQNVPPPPPVPDVPIVEESAEAISESPSFGTPSENTQKPGLSQIDRYFSEVSPEHIERIRDEYDEYLEYVNELYTRYATHKKLDYNEISNKIKQLVIFIRQNQKAVLRITPSEKERKKNFLVSHSMRSTVLAITIGEALHLPPVKLVNLGIACILHEIGQIRLPPQLYMTDRLLTAPEKVQMTKHPIIGYNILKEHNFPLEIQLGVLDHHERENGTGYPRKILGDKITSFAKIISVACSYEAISAPRLFREERSTYEAMREMMLNHDKAYDATVIKALLKSLSLFPIGTYVQLADGNLAQVIDVTPEEPRCPQVQIVQPDTFALGEVTETKSEKHKIVRVLSRKEIAKIKQLN